jgi:hypothetical protein
MPDDVRVIQLMRTQEASKRDLNITQILPTASLHPTHCTYSTPAHISMGVSPASIRFYYIN